MLPKDVVEINPNDTLRVQMKSIIDELYNSAQKGFPFIAVDILSPELRQWIESAHYRLKKWDQWYVVYLDQYYHSSCYKLVDSYTMFRILKRQREGAKHLVTSRNKCSDSFQQKLCQNGYTITDVNGVVIKISWQ